MDKKSILSWLIRHNKTLGAVESLTGGMFASSVVDVPGASATFRGAIVTYATELKTKLVDVSEETIATYGVVSSKTALEMALGGKKQLNVDFCLSFTGNAGPEVQDNRQVGDVYIALTFSDVEVIEHFSLDGERNQIRKAAVQKGWDLLERVIKEQKENYL
ncbi:MAG TPA: CinA family protein [Bacilli bacterium]|nr:CinA family protein [Bacilli bacterium]